MVLIQHIDICISFQTSCHSGFKRIWIRVSYRYHFHHYLKLPEPELCQLIMYFLRLKAYSAYSFSSLSKSDPHDSHGIIVSPFVWSQHLPGLNPHLSPGSIALRHRHRAPEGIAELQRCGARCKAQQGGALLVADHEGARGFGEPGRLNFFPFLGDII